MRSQQRLAAWAGLLACALTYALLVLPLSYAVRSAMSVPRRRTRGDDAAAPSHGGAAPHPAGGAQPQPHP